MYNKILDKIRIQIKEFISKYNISVKYFSTNNRMLARGAFIGIYIAMIPMPLQMLAVLLCTFIGRFNLPIALALCWITNPFTMPFIYYIEYVTGSYLLGIPLADLEISAKWFMDNFDNIILPLYVGAFFYSIVLSLLFYQLILRACVNSRCKKVFF